MQSQDLTSTWMRRTGLRNTRTRRNLRKTRQQVRNKRRARSPVSLPTLARRGKKSARILHDPTRKRNAGPTSKTFCENTTDKRHSWLQAPMTEVRASRWEDLAIRQQVFRHRAQVDKPLLHALCLKASTTRTGTGPKRVPGSPVPLSHWSTSPGSRARKTGLKMPPASSVRLSVWRLLSCLLKSDMNCKNVLYELANY